MNNDSQPPKGVNQTSHGDQSPNISTENGAVNITYNNSGVTQKQFDQLIEELDVSRTAAVRLLKNLDEKDVALKDREAQFKDLLKKHNELEQRLAGRDDDVSKQARDLLVEGKLDEAKELLKVSIASRLKDLEKQQELAAADVFALGGIQELELNYTGARDSYKQAVDLDPDNSTYLNNLGLIEHELGHHKEAIGLFEQALAIDRAVYGEKHPSVAIYLNNLGGAWDNLGEYQKAIGLIEQALAIYRAAYGEEHPNVATSLNILGGAWDALGKHQKAIGLYKQALAIDRAVYGEEHPDVATTLNNLGEARRMLGDYQKAIGFYEQALAIDRAVYGEEHPNVATILNNLAGIWDALGKHQKAIGLYEQALAIDRAVYGEEHLNVAVDLNNLGGTWGALGKHQKAIGFYEQALAIFTEMLGSDHPSTQTVAWNLQQARDAIKTTRWRSIYRWISKQSF